MFNKKCFRPTSYRWYIPITYQTNGGTVQRSWFRDGDMERKFSFFVVKKFSELIKKIIFSEHSECWCTQLD